MAKCSNADLHCFLRTGLLLYILLPTPALSSCVYPESIVMEKADSPWYSHVTSDGSREIEYYIRRTVMEIHHADGEKEPVRWTCVMAHGGKLLLKRQDYLSNKYYKCTRFYLRSNSIVQIAWSHESKVFDLKLCADELLILDPWPLVKFDAVETDYTPCPFSGGYNIKISDSQKGENGCNLMHRPMRMEAECVGGSGVVFDFISDICLPDVNMFVQQKTTSIAGWEDDKNYYVILRRHEDIDLWCLVMSKEKGRRKTAYIYSDLICRHKNDFQGFIRRKKRDLKYLTLSLDQRVFSSLCEDEYTECSSVGCNQYVKQECMRSCNVCNHSVGLQSCSFPRRFKGSWFLKESEGYRQITIDRSDMFIEGVGAFHCVHFPDSPSKKSRIFSTVSISDNGCRPRYTCIKLHRLAPAVLKYSLSQSYSWPVLKNKIAQTMCDSERFQADPAPIDDLYRSHYGSGKPIVAQSSFPTPVECDLNAVYTLSATLPEGYVCPGRLYRHCEDSSKIRLDFSSCEGLVEMVTDFRCLATFQGHYWEKILLVQDLSHRVDIKCFVFNEFKPNDAYMMVASECDQKSFNFAREEIRQPLLSLKFRKEETPCLSVPPVTEATTISSTASTTSAPSRHSMYSLASGHTSLSHSNRTHADQSHYERDVSKDNENFLEGGKSDRKYTAYSEDENGEENLSGRRNSLGSKNKHNSADYILTNKYIFTMLILTPFFMECRFR